MTTSLPTLEDLCEPSLVSREHEKAVSPSGKKKSRFLSSKIFCDPVHGQITLHPACVAIIDTPQFQRLRHIRQTGFLEHVYPGSSHNRFGHSLGVCYLAVKFLQELRDRQPELNLSDTDILCVGIAGLCHDLGHGPYSHTWEIFMSDSSSQKSEKKHWKHEKVSANMLDYLIKENNLLPVLKEYGIGLGELNQIKQYILGDQPKDKSKAYLYQVINNDDSGLDVDKFDYFLRDCLHLGLPCSFEYERLMQYAKVFNVDGRAQICFRDKTLESVYNVFRTRSNLHRMAYQHKLTILIERMFLDALEMVDDRIVGLDGKVLHFWEWSMAAAYEEGERLQWALEKFCSLTDDLINCCLKLTPIPELQKASNLFKAIDKRSCKTDGFYQHVGLRIVNKHCKKEKILSDICEFLPRAHSVMMSGDLIDDETIKPVLPSDICVCVKHVNWGKGSQNPVEFVHFYSKDDTFKRRCTDQLEVSVMLPKSYEEIQVHVLCRRSDNFAFNIVRWCYDMYWEYSCSKNNSNV